ncbi:MAG: hypothetical protein JW751_29580 [Polyangiaceae bacterium]|nr:hypothetical protein [Polyangiaceae bacterium]
MSSADVAGRGSGWDGDGVARCAYDPDHPEAWREEPDCLGNPLLTHHCRGGSPRGFRLAAQRLEVPVPYPDSVVVIACLGEVLRE